MPQEPTYEEKYIKGFNEGYLLAKHMPDLAEKLSQLKSENPRMEGIRDGRGELLAEREYYPQWMKRDVSKLLKGGDKDDRELYKDKE